MRRFSMLLSVVVVVLLGSAVVLSRPAASAQEATPTGMAATSTHPVVGTWELTAEGTIVAYEYVDDRLLRGEGRWTAEVDETGNAIDTNGPFVARFVDDGSVDLAVEGPVPGTRLDVPPVVPLSDLVPGGT